jgi:hypothetical protein
MALQTMIEKLNEAKKAYEAQLAELGKQGQKAVADFLAPLIPPGYKLMWTQYTPYFNDGEACHFGVHDAYLVKDGEEGRLDDIGIGIYDAISKYGTADEEKSYETDDYSKELPRQPGDSLYTRRYAKKKVFYTDHGLPAIDGYSKETLKELGQAWSALPEDLLEQAFGDHARCSISSDGTSSVDEYSHD